MTAYGSIRNRMSIIDDLVSLTDHHVKNCSEYARICNSLFANYREAKTLGDLPFLPAQLYKHILMTSVPHSEIMRVMTSSGTTGRVSRIALDRETIRSQSHSLAQIMKHWLGSRRLPMLIVDQRDLLVGRDRNTARAAAIIGMMQLGANHHWLLDESGAIDVEGLREWLQRHNGEKLFAFGFTAQVWDALAVKMRAIDVTLPSAVLFHGGGWKRLTDQRVTRDSFHQEIGAASGISIIHDYYGMVEQLGSIWVEAEPGIYVPPLGSAVICRDPISLEVLDSGEPGLVQVFSTLPRSYPGHSILTDDLGTVVELDRNIDLYGRYGLQLLGRLPKSDPRGCSDAASEQDT